MNLNIKSVLLMAALGASSAILSCQKDEKEIVTPDVVDPIPFTPGFSADVDDVPFDVENYGWNYNALDSTITISATTDIVGQIADSTHFIGFTVPSTITTGAYTFTGDEITGYYNVGLDTDDQYSPPAGSGTLIILSHNQTDHKIVGKFSFVAVPSQGNSNSNFYDISNGKFSIEYN